MNGHGVVIGGILFGTVGFQFIRSIHTRRRWIAEFVGAHGRIGRIGRYTHGIIGPRIVVLGFDRVGKRIAIGTPIGLF
jgi:hypothetical protein